MNVMWNLVDRFVEQDKYFEDAKKWEDFHCKLSAEEGLDAWYRVFNRIAGFFPDWDVQIASEAPGRSYFSGIFRALNDSTHLHCDIAPYDSHTEDWIINSVEYQIVFNLYLAPVKDGRTVSCLTCSSLQLHLVLYGLTGVYRSYTTFSGHRMHSSNATQTVTDITMTWYLVRVRSIANRPSGHSACSTHETCTRWKP